MGAFKEVAVFRIVILFTFMLMIIALPGCSSGNTMTGSAAIVPGSEDISDRYSRECLSCEQNQTTAKTSVQVTSYIR